MADVTWRQFKEIVDRKIAEAGKDDSIPIEYIDVSSATLTYGGKVPDKAIEVACDDGWLAVF